MKKFFLLAIASISMTTATFGADAPAVIPPDDATMAKYLGRFDPVYFGVGHLRSVPEAVPLGNGRLGATMKVQTRMEIGSSGLVALANNGANWNWFESAGRPPTKEAFRLQLDRQDAYGPDVKDFGSAPTHPWDRDFFGDLVLTLRGQVVDATGRLDLWNATGTVQVQTTVGSVTVRCFILSDPDVVVIHRTATGAEKDATWDYEAHDYGWGDIAPNYKKTGRVRENSRPWDRGIVKADRQGKFEVRTHPSDGGENAVVWHASKLSDGSEVVVVSYLMSPLGPTLKDALATLEKAVQLGGIEVLQKRHQENWHALWRRHFISMPDARIANGYYAAMYRFMAQFRPDGTMGDDPGQWPNPYGGWHIQTLNFNVQVQFSPGVAANLADHALPLVNTVNRAIRQLQVDAGDKDPLAISTIHEGTDVWLSHTGNKYRQEPVLTIDDIPDVFSVGTNLVERMIGTQPGGPEGPANMAHLLFEYYRYYRSTMDEKAGRRLFKLAKMNMRTFLYQLGPKKEDGKYHLPPFSVPERGSYPDSAYGLSSIQMLCRVIMELDERWKLNDPDRALWVDIRANLADYPHIPGPVLLRKHDVNQPPGQLEMELVEGPSFVVWHGQDQRGKTEAEIRKRPTDQYRHWTHLYQIYPYHVIDEQDPKSRQLIRNSVRLFTGLQDSMAGCPRTAMWAALGEGENARDQLHYFTGMALHWTFYGRMPLIESPLMVGHCIQNMFLMSHWGTIRVFPAIPRDWADAAIHQMRAQGAFLVSAKRSGGQTRWIRIASEAGEPCRVRTDLARPIEAVGAREFTVTAIDDQTITIDLKKGESVLLKTKGSTPDMTIGPVADDGWVNWFPYRYYEAGEKEVRTAQITLDGADDQALAAAIAGGNAATLVGACNVIRLQSTRPGPSVRDALLKRVTGPTALNGAQCDAVVRALCRWERDEAVAKAFGGGFEGCRYQSEPMLFYRMAQAGTLEERKAILGEGVEKGGSTMPYIAVNELVASGQMKVMEEMLAADKNVRRIPLALAAACADHPDPKVRQEAMAIIAKHLDHPDSHAVGMMLAALSKFGADAAPYLDKIKAVNRKGDNWCMSNRDQAIQAIEKAIKEKEKKTP